MRAALSWVIGIVAGIAVVLVVTAAIGNRDKSGQTVPAGNYAQTVCGVVGTWRGEMEAIIDQIRTPPAVGTLGTEEPQSETPQGRTELIRTGLQSSVRATKTLVDGIDNAGVPDTPQGSAAAKEVSDWADSSRDDLENAQSALEKEAGTLEDAVGQVRAAAGAISSTLVNGVQTIGSAAKADPQLAAAFRDSSTCQQLREEQSAT